MYNPVIVAKRTLPLTGSSSKALIATVGGKGMSCFSRVEASTTARPPVSPDIHTQPLESWNIRKTMAEARLGDSLLRLSSFVL